MSCEVDPRGDTLITLQDANNLKEVISENQFLVSKKHLVLASPRARKVLEGSFKEATPGDDGLFHWKFEPIFDPKAFEIVMKIIHGQTRYIPREIDLALLAQITAIVDDLECHNTVWFFAKSWLKHIENRIPREICEDLMRWILISFVFEEPELFRKATAIAIKYSTDVLHTFNLPIRPKILDDIGVKRENIFKNMFSRIYHLEYQLLGSSIGCNKGCRAMMLGTLSQGLRWSSLSACSFTPYVSLSIRRALEELKAIKSLDYYCAEQESTNQTKSENEETVPSKLVRHKCRLEDHLSLLLRATIAEFEGLELSKYLDNEKARIIC
ncbi:hypothetical protein J3E68DRAFT_451318 [Trichoderma sp. SZMC 28012]